MSAEEKVRGYLHTHWDCACGVVNHVEGHAAGEIAECDACGHTITIRRGLVSAGSLRERVAEALDLHTVLTGVRDLRKRCTCGWTSEERQGLTAHRAHLADAVLAVVRAWLGSVDAITGVVDEVEHKDWCREPCTCMGARNRGGAGDPRRPDRLDEGG